MSADEVLTYAAVTLQRYPSDLCGRYATFGPVSVSRQAREVLEELDLDIISEVNQRGPQCNEPEGIFRQRPSPMPT